MTDHDDSHSDLEVIDLAAQVEATAPRSKLVPPNTGGPSRRKPGNVRVWPIVVAVAVVGIAWSVIAVVALLGIRSEVTSTRDSLLAGRDALESGDVEGADALFSQAADDLQAIPARLASPAVLPARLVPSVRRSVDAVGELSRAGSLAARSAARVASTLAAGDGGLGALTPTDGRIPLEAITALTPVLERAATDVATAVEMAEGVPTGGVVASVVEGRREFLDVLRPTAEQLSLGADVTAVLPALFGMDEPRRYVVMASNPTEARGTGGFFGAYTVMEAIDGRLTFGEVGETVDLPIPTDSSVVEWVDESLRERWEEYGGATRVRSINMTPDFPSAASMVENYWAAVLNDALDGVIAVDPFAFEAMLRVNGPIELPGFGAISADEVVDFVSYSAYGLITNPIERKRLVGNVATSTFQGFLDGPGDVTPAQVLDALGSMASRDSLLIHSVHPEEQALLEAVDLAGVFDPGEGDLLAVILNSGSGSKIDYFLERSIRYEVSLAPDGVANSVVSAGFVNNAPSSGELEYMIGPPAGVEFEAGENVTHVSVYCAPGCRIGEAPDVGYADLPTERGEELGFPYASTWALIPSMQSLQLIYSYTTPGAWIEEADGERVYSLRYEHQTAVRPTSLDIRVRIPDGFVATELPEGAEVEDDEVIIRVEAIQDLDLRVRLAPA